MLQLFYIFSKQSDFINLGILRENQIATGNIDTISLSASQNCIFSHVKALLNQMTPYDSRNQSTECFSDDESEDTLDDTMVYLRVFYFYSYNLKFTKI